MKRIKKVVIYYYTNYEGSRYRIRNNKDSKNRFRRIDPIQRSLRHPERCITRAQIKDTMIKRGEL